MNRQTIKDTLVVHEGLSNYPNLRWKIEKISEELKNITTNIDNHLSDLGCRLTPIIQKLEKYQNELFELHKKEKKLHKK